MSRLGAGGIRDRAERVGSEVVVPRVSCVFSSQDGGEQLCLHHLSLIPSGAVGKARCSFYGRKSNAQGNLSALKQEQDLQPLLLPAQDLSPMQECISAAIPIHTDPRTPTLLQPWLAQYMRAGTTRQQIAAGFMDQEVQGVPREPGGCGSFPCSLDRRMGLGRGV